MKIFTCYFSVWFPISPFTKLAVPILTLRHMSSAAHTSQYLAGSSEIITKFVVSLYSLPMLDRVLPGELWGSIFAFATLLVVGRFA